MECIFESFTKKGCKLPQLPGDYLQQPARQPSKWMAKDLQPVTSAKVAVGGDLLLDCESKGMKPWETQSRHWYQIGIMVRQSTKGAPIPVMKEDPTATQSSEQAVVGLYDRHIGYPVNHTLSIVANQEPQTTASDFASEAEPTFQPLVPPTFVGKIHTMPETTLRLLDDITIIKRELKNAKRAGAASSALRKTRANVTVNYIGRPDTLIGFANHETEANGEQTPIREFLKIFQAAVVVEFKNSGRINRKSFEQAYRRPSHDDPSIRGTKARSQPYNTRSGRDFNNDLPTNLFDKQSLNIIRQLGGYALLCRSRYGICFDGFIIILNRFGNISFEKKATMALGDHTAIAIIDIREVSRDVVLTTVVGFVFEGFMQKLAAVGQGYSADVLSQMVKTFLEQFPDLSEAMDFGGADRMEE